MLAGMLASSGGAALVAVFGRSAKYATMAAMGIRSSGMTESSSPLLQLKGEWIAVPLCPEHKNVVADHVGPETIVLDARRQN